MSIPETEPKAVEMKLPRPTAVRHATLMAEKDAEIRQRDRKIAEQNTTIDGLRRQIDSMGEPIRDLTEKLDTTLAERNDARENAERLQAERDQWKAESKRYQDSLNNLSAQIKEQGRDTSDRPDGIGGAVLGFATAAVCGAIMGGVGFWVLHLLIGGGK